MNSLCECVTCKDIKDNTYLLPCLHPTCSQCTEEIVQDAKQKKRKLPGCRDCGEPFLQEKLAIVSSNNDRSSFECAECGIAGAYFCRDCNEHLCKLHGDAHPTTRRFKGHVVQLVVEVPFCNKHSSETALGFCTHCNLLICGPCVLAEHNKLPHLSISLDEKTDFINKNVAELLESIPAIDKEIKKHTDIRTKLEKERAELEAKIGDIRSQEKATTLQIEDLEKTKALLLTTQTQANTLASAASTLPHSNLLRLQSVITARISNLQHGLGLMSGLISSASSPSATIFNRVLTQNITVSNNGQTITKNVADDDFGYGISDDGCSSGIRSWRIIINSMDASSYSIAFGIWNSSDAPSSDRSFDEENAWLVFCCTDVTEVWKAGSYTSLDSASPLQSGDVLLLTVDADQRRLTVQNTTRGWTHTVDQLPLPNPAHYPHVVLYEATPSKLPLKLIVVSKKINEFCLSEQ